MMRIQFTSTTLPKKASKRLLDFRSLFDAELTLGMAQNITAYMLGYSSWSELLAFTANNKTPSLLDEDISPGEREGRYDYQELRLADHSHYFPDDPLAMHMIVRLVQVSARTPSNESLPEYSTGAFIFPSGRGPVTYQASIREDLFSLELNELWSLLDDGALPVSIHDQLVVFTARFPDNLNAIALMLNNFHRQDRIHPKAEAVKSIEARVVQLYDTLSDHGVKKLSWDHHENRDFLRVCFQLGEYFALTNDVEKKGEWKSRLKALTNIFNKQFT